VIPLGHRTYLEPKGEGESSMFGKAGRGETVKPHACRGPDGMVKARLPEPQCPLCKTAQIGNDGRYPRLPKKHGSGSLPGEDEPMAFWSVRHAPGEQGRIDGLKDTNGAPATVLNVNCVRNMGSPKSREAHGDRASIVVRGWESQPHGEGRQVNRITNC